MFFYEKEKEKMYKLFAKINSNIKKKIFSDVSFYQEFKPIDVMDTIKDNLKESKNTDSLTELKINQNMNEQTIWQKIYKHFFYIDELNYTFNFG